ncbi:MAG: hypothetical protein EBS23_00610 [Betaproteobacteria bacterium]|nr:hypothetical protein [Betaproteobacteria bacterium]
MPIGTLLHHIVEQDAPGLVPLTVLEEAADIQRQLIVIAAFKRDLHTEGLLVSRLSPHGRETLRGATVSSYLAPAEGLLADFARTHLADPDADLSAYLTVAKIQQTANAVAPEVPTIGIILSSPAAALGPDGRALFDRDLVRAALIVSACLQALVPDSRRPVMLAPRAGVESERSASARDRGFDLGFAVRSTQQIAGAVLSGEHPLDASVRTTLLGYLRLAERRLVRDGFSTFAGQLSVFRQHAMDTGAMVPPQTLTVS